MLINVNGYAKKDFAPDQIKASAIFQFHAENYDDALRGGVEQVKKYIESICGELGFTNNDFKTEAYNVREEFTTNKLTPSDHNDLNKVLEKRVSTGFYFNQYVNLIFDYNRERLAKLLVFSSKIDNAPLLRINFVLKDQHLKEQLLLAEAYNEAKKKADILAAAAGKTLGDCTTVDIDGSSLKNQYSYLGLAEEGSFEKSASINNAINQELRNIEESFKPNDIKVSKTIFCTWEAN